jgi:hypothetical protein
MIEDSWGPGLVGIGFVLILIFLVIVALVRLIS